MDLRRLFPKLVHVNLVRSRSARNLRGL